MTLRAMPMAVVFLLGPVCGGSGGDVSGALAVPAERDGDAGAVVEGPAEPGVRPGEGPDDGASGGGDPGAAPAPIPTAADRLREANEAFLAGRWADAEAGFRGSLGEWPEVDGVVRWWTAQAAWRAGHLDDARSDAEALAAGSGRHAKRAAALAAEIALAQERWADAARILGGLLSGTVPRELDSAALLMGLARAVEAMGDSARARTTYETLVRRYPERPQSAEAEARLRALDPGFEIPAEWRLDRARELVRHRDWAEAIDELDRIPAGARRPPPETVAFERAMAIYKHRRRYDEAERGFAAVVEMHGPHEAEAALHRARSLARDHRDADAIDAYRAFAGKYPHGPDAGDAAYLAASLELYLGRFDDAIRSFGALVGRNRAGPARPDSRWSLAMAYMLAGRPAEALELIDGTEDDDDGSLVRGRALYWGAVARESLGKRAEAVERLETVIADYPLHWYALLARGRLAALGGEVPPPFPSREIGRDDPGDRCDDLPPAIAALRSAGLVDDARAELLDALGSDIEAATGDDLRAIVRKLLCVDGVEAVHRHVVSAHDDRYSSSLDPDTLPFWEASYPRAYRGRVDAACEREGMSPYLAWAIMRQESSFDPDTISYADAIGLLQMIPPTTRRIVEAAGGVYDDSLLLDPSSNIDLAVGYIAWIGRKFHGQVPLQAAGFNGGPHNVARWLDSFAETRLDYFVERIPFGQTRNYVRRVVTSYARFLYLYETDGNDWPLELPDTVRLDYLPDPDF